MSVPSRRHIPRRMGQPPRRMGAAGRAGPMFPHTITLYNVSVETDKATLESTVVNHITLLNGVLLAASKAVNVRASGMEGADAVNLYIPFDVEAVDAMTGEGKQYLPPVEFWRAEARDRFWTLAISAKGSSLDGYTFFIKGVALPPEGAKPEKVAELVEGMFDHVYNITKVDEMDYGGLKHFEVGGN